MITPTEIVKHLKTYLPIFTDKFTNLLTVSAASVDASNVVSVTAAKHGKTEGQSVIITAGSARNPLTAAVLGTVQVTFTTVYDHDLIKPSQPLDDQTLTLAGFDSVWDDTFDIIDVPNRRSFTVLLPDGETLAPAVDETQYLIEERKAGLAGVQTVATVPTINTFTIDLSGMPLLPPGPIDGLEVISGFRIAAAADFQRAQDVYSKQAAEEAYLFVIMTDLDVSKDRHTLNDGIAGFTRQDMMLLRVLQNFSTTVFLPTGADLSGADAQDVAYGTLVSALISALFGLEETTSTLRYLTVLAGTGPAEYNTAYYAHVYDWQLPGVLTYEDGFLQWPDVAFRDISQTLKLFNDSEAGMVVNINLDEEPI